MQTELRFGLDWELWIVEQLLFDARLDDLIADLIERGVPEGTARDGVHGILGSDGFRRLRERLGEATLAARLQRLQRDLVDALPPSRTTLDAETLLQDHWVPSLPVVLTDAFGGLPALSWTPASLGERFGAVPVGVNVQRDQATDPSDVERLEARRPFADLVARMGGPPTNAEYAVSRNGLLAEPGLRPLWDDLAPLPGFLVPPTPPTGVALWMGPEGTVTPPHFDPHNSVLLQVHGRKRIRLAPRLRAALHGLVDGYYLRGGLDDAFGARVRTVELDAGQALFVPAGWFHEVTALAPSITLSFLCFPWDNHFHYLGPPGSDDSRPFS